MSLSLQYDYSNCLAGAIGSERGLSGEELCQFASTASSALVEIQRERKQGKHFFLDLPAQAENRERVHEAVRAVLSHFQEPARLENLAILGIGGSALGMTALHSAFVFPFQRVAPKKNAPCVFVLDNVDPEFFAAFLAQADLAKTLFLVISKSGGTAETLAQFQIVREKLLAVVGKEHRKNLLVLTDPETSLAKTAKELGYSVVRLWPEVGGRFSVLSPVGLLPAALCGIDIEEVCRGADAMERRCRSESFAENPALQFAAVHFLLHTKKQTPLFVHFAYSERLRGFADWYRQLFAESLGKRKDLQGRDIYVGPTPIPASGVTDQHSQVQLYTEGPFDKVFTFLSVKKFAADLQIPDAIPGFASAKALSGNTLGELFHAEEEGTRQALTAAKRPHGTIYFPSVCAHALGEYILLMELSVALMGKFYRIDPYDQPGVEAGKVAARRILEERKRGR